MSKRWLQIELDRQSNRLLAIKRERDHVLNSLNKLNTKIEESELGLEKLAGAAEAYKLACERDKDKEIRVLKSEIDRLQKSKSAIAAATEEVDITSIAKATTLSILDSIIFAIGNWSTDGQTAPDVELACQSVLFPIVYEPVMKGESDYYISTIPISALEVVRRGREFVRDLRESCDLMLTVPEVWSDRAVEVQTWWLNDALPLLYGARDDWEIDQCFSLSEIIEWRDMPASRALHFPLIWDGMELVKKHSDEIRDASGLPEFNKQQLQTRISL